MAMRGVAASIGAEHQATASQTQHACQPASCRSLTACATQDEDDLQRVLAVNAAQSLARDVLGRAGSAPAALVDLLFNQSMKHQHQVSRSLPGAPAQLLAGTAFTSHDAMSHDSVGPPTRYGRIPADIGLAMQLQQLMAQQLEPAARRRPSRRNQLHSSSEHELAEQQQQQQKQQLPDNDQRRLRQGSCTVEHAGQQHHGLQQEEQQQEMQLDELPLLGPMEQPEEQLLAWHEAIFPGASPLRKRSPSPAPDMGPAGSPGQAGAGAATLDMLPASGPSTSTGPSRGATRSGSPAPARSPAPGASQDPDHDAMLHRALFGSPAASPVTGGELLAAMWPACPAWLPSITAPYPPRHGEGDRKPWRTLGLASWCCIPRELLLRLCCIL
jgi:hypothetical protein